MTNFGYIKFINDLGVKMATKSYNKITSYMIFAMSNLVSILCTYDPIPFLSLRMTLPNCPIPLQMKELQIFSRLSTQTLIWFI